MSKSKRIGIKAIKKALSECSFDPDNLGDLRIIFDNPRIGYYPERARELILEAIENNPDLFDQRITMAIQLLIWSKVNGKSQ